MLMKLMDGYEQILQNKNSKVRKKTDKSSVSLFSLLGSSHEKAARKMLVSISSMLYAQIFHTNVVSAAFF